MALNLYPVKTKYSSGIIRNLRLRADDSGTVVWRMNSETGLVEEFLRTPEPPSRVGVTQSWRAEGLVFEPQRGCGCNHPMYTWVPPEDSP